MTEYLRTDGEPLTINYVGQLDTTTIVVSIYDVLNDEYIGYDEYPHIDPLDNTSAFSIVLNSDITKYDRELILEVQGVGQNSYYDDKLYVTLIRPFVTYDEIISYFQYNQNSADSILAGQPEQYILKLEKKARYYVSSYVNDSFKFEYKTVGSYGMNTDLLHLGQRIESFDKITYDDHVIYDNTTDPVTDELGATLAVAPSKFAIKVVADGVNIAEWADLNYLNNPSYFGSDSAYLVRGEYGWKSVPEDVKTATLELINDFLCNDYIYRNKGLKSIQNDAFTLQFADGMLNGTGNLYVDALLAPYKSWNLRAI